MGFRNYISPPNSIPAQALVLSIDKHRYFLKGGGLRYSQKELAADSSKIRFRSYLLCDEQTDTFYAEAEPADRLIDVLGFMARAWARKPWHFFRGYAQELQVSRALLKDPVVSSDVQFVLDSLGIDLIHSTFPPWYAHLVRRFSQGFDLIDYRWIQYGLDWNVSEIDKISALACLESTLQDKPGWDRVTENYPRKALSEEWMTKIDAQYKPYAGWRTLLHEDWPELTIALGRS